MAAALGQLLASAGAVSKKELAAALRQQVLYGARLGTNLIELGFAGHDHVALALGRIHGVPAALEAHLEASDPRARDRVAADLCTELVALPLGFAPGDRLVICMRDPADPSHHARLEAEAALEVIPAACPELSLYRLLHHYCDARPPARLAAVREGGRGPAPAALAEGAPPMPALIPKDGPAPAPPSLEELAESLCQLLDSARDVERWPEEESARGPGLSLQTAIAVMATAVHRSQVADAVVGFASGHFDVAVLLDVRGELARGYRATGLERADALEISLAEPSAFQLAERERRRVVDPPGGDRVLEEALARVSPRRPDTLLIEPIEIRERVVCLLYAHRLEGSPPPEAWEQLGTLSAACSDAFLRLIRARRRTTMVPAGD